MRRMHLVEGKLALIKLLSKGIVLKWLLPIAGLGLLIPMLPFRRAVPPEAIERSLQTWERGETHDPSQFALVEKGVKAAKSSKFSPRIAQQLLFFGEEKLATEYLRDAMLHSKGRLPPWYALFSTVTYCIAEHKFQEALDESYALRKEMDVNGAMKEECKMLYLCNEVRILALERELILRPQAAQTAKNLLKLSESAEYTQAFLVLDQCFREGGIGLKELFRQEL